MATLDPPFLLADDDDERLKDEDDDRWLGWSKDRSPGRRIVKG